jgi:hypothetical protein
LKRFWPGVNDRPKSGSDRAITASWGLLLTGPVEEKRDVAAQMDDAVARNLGIADRLGKNACKAGLKSCKKNAKLQGNTNLRDRSPVESRHGRREH